MKLKLTKEQKKKLTLIGSFVSLSALLILLLLALFVGFNHTFGWFAANKDVTAGGMQIVINNDNFKIAIQRTGNENQISGLETSDPDNILGVLENKMGFTRGTRITSFSNTKLLCNLIHENEVISENPNERGIRPNSYGQFSFYIDPLGDTDAVFDIDLTITGLPIMNPDTQSISELTEGLLKGHIFFYQSRTQADSPNSYYYSGRILDSFEYDLSQHTSDTVTVDGTTYYLVTIYWVWPNSFSQIIYQEGAGRLAGQTPLSGSASTSAEDIQAARQYVIENPEQYFLFSEDNTYSGEITESIVTSDDYYGTFNLAYNNADQHIGETVSYLVVECMVSEQNSVD